MIESMHEDGTSGSPDIWSMGSTIRCAGFHASESTDESPAPWLCESPCLIRQYQGRKVVNIVSSWWLRNTRTVSRK